MNAPMLWIVIPLVVALVLFVIRRRRRLTAALGAFVCLFLALTALVVEVDVPIDARFFQFTIRSELLVLGRSFSIAGSELPWLAVLFGAGTIWFVWILFIQQRLIYVPLGMAIITGMVAAITVRPFIYAALILEIVTIAYIPFMISEGARVTRGVLRFLIYQTLGVPLLLFAGWLLAGGEIAPISGTTLTQSAVMLGLGFALWFGVFPFYSWIPMISEEVSPLVSGFVFSIHPLAVLIFLLDFLNTYPWLREFPALYIAFRWLGLIMIITGGLWAIFEQKVIKMVGYGALVSSGLALLSLGIRGASGMQLLTYSIIPRLLSLIVLSSSLAILMNKQSGTQVQDMQGHLWKTPTSATAFLLSLFSLSGVPCLPYFPLLTGLLIELTVRSSGLLIPLFIGVILFIINGYRLLNILFRRKEDIQHEGEPLAIRILLVFLLTALILIGMFPSLLQPLQTQLLNHYPFLL